MTGAQNTNFGERRRDVLTTIVKRRMEFANQFFGVGQRPYGTKAVPDAEAIAMYGRLSPAEKVSFYQQLQPEDQQKLRANYGTGGQTPEASGG